MTAASPMVPETQILDARKFRHNRKNFRLIDPVYAVLRAIWPVKTAQNIATETHVSERTAEFWLAGKHDMSYAAARKLLRSAHGYEFLIAYVGEDCEAPWFIRVRNMYGVHNLKRSIRTQEKRLAHLREQQKQLDMFAEQ